MRRVDRNVTWVDHALCLAAALCICFVSGNSIGKPSISAFFIPIALVCGLAGMGIGRLAKGRKIEQFDWALYCGVAFVTIINIRTLNEVLPDEGFPFQIVMMSFLSWLICLGQLVTWRDTTMAFHAVPCIAAFGLVGAFDYQPTPYVFFAFLLCMASLFFRVHARSMLKRAEASFALSSDREEMGDQRKLWERAFATGAWRWMAGTGWALSSALLIVLLSLLGAPLVQYSVQAVAGRVQFTLPNRPQQQQPQGGGNTSSDGSLRLGNGPVSQTGFPLFKLKTEGTNYWRTESYDNYNGRRWTSRLSNRNLQFVPFNQQELRALYPNHQPQAFELERVRFGLASSQGLEVPTPTTVLAMNTSQHSFRVNPDLTILQLYGSSPTIRGQWLVAPRAVTPNKSVAPPEYRGQFPLTEIGPRNWLSQFTQSAITEGSTDYEKAVAISRWIGNRCKYNLKAAAPPEDSDVVLHFLTDGREGYCDLFASAMTMMARDAGLHARMSGGFLVQGERDEQGYQTATDREAHVWCEVYFDKVGWVIFDPTEYAEDITPKDEDVAGNRKNLINLIMQIVIGVVGVGGLLAMVFALRVERKKLAEKTVASQLGVFYRGYLAKVERVTQRPCLLAETPREYLQRVQHRLGEGRAEAVALSELFTTWLYAPAEAPESVRKEIESKVQGLKRTLRPSDAK